VFDIIVTETANKTKQTIKKHNTKVVDIFFKIHTICRILHLRFLNYNDICDDFNKQKNMYNT